MDPKDKDPKKETEEEIEDPEVVGPEEDEDLSNFPGVDGYSTD